MTPSPEEKLKSKAAAMPAPTAVVVANAAPAKSKTDPPAAGFGSKMDFIVLLASLTAIGLGSSWGYFYGRNYYITRARVLTDATVVDVPPTVGTVGGEYEAGVCLSDESEIGEDFVENSSDDEEYSSSSDDEEESSSEDEADSSDGGDEAVVDKSDKGLACTYQCCLAVDKCDVIELVNCDKKGFPGLSGEGSCEDKSPFEEEESCQTQATKLCGESGRGRAFGA